MKKILKTTMKIALPLLVAGGLLYWMYRDFDFAEAKHILLHETNVWWLLASLIPITLSHVIRGLRWLLTLAPLGYRPKVGDSVDSIFVAYAANVLVPRVGEVSRCAVLTKYDRIPFSKALGTLVAERLIDMLLVAVFVCVMLLTQFDVFRSLFATTGTSGISLGSLLVSPKTYIVIAAIVAGAALLWLWLKNTTLYAKMKQLVRGFVDCLLLLSLYGRPECSAGACNLCSH